jgi:hypothetical protein
MAVVGADDDLPASIGLQVPDRGNHLATIYMEGESKRGLGMWRFFSALPPGNAVDGMERSKDC